MVMDGETHGSGAAIMVGTTIIIIHGVGTDGTIGVGTVLGLTTLGDGAIMDMDGAVTTVPISILPTDIMAMPITATEAMPTTGADGVIMTLLL